MNFRALNFDYQLEASVYVESTRRSREVIFIRQAVQAVRPENFEPTSEVLDKVETEKVVHQETRDSRPELSSSMPLPHLCCHEKVANSRMSELQFRKFMSHIRTVAATKRIGSCPWHDIESQKDTKVERGVSISHAHHDPFLSSARPEAHAHTMKEIINCSDTPEVRPPAEACLALVPYEHYSERAHNNNAFDETQVCRQDMEVMLFAMQVAMTANTENLLTRKRSFDDIRSNQHEGDARHPFRKRPKPLGVSDSLFETSRNKLVSFQGLLETSRSTEVGPLHETFKESLVPDEKISDIPVHEFSNVDVESKAQRRKRKEDKKKRRDQKRAKILEKEMQRIERHASNQAQSKRDREDPIRDETREKVSILAPESSETQCYNMESDDHDLLPDDAEVKRRKTEAFTVSLNEIQPGENAKQTTQSPRESLATHNDVVQLPRLPFGAKVSSTFSFPGKTGLAWKKQETPSSTPFDPLYGAAQSQAQRRKQAFVREHPIEDTAKKTISSAMPSGHGLAKHQKSYRPESRPNCLTNKKVESIVGNQGEPPNSRPTGYAHNRASVQDNFIGVNGAPDPIQVLCTESFLETWGDLVYAITSSNWPQPHSSVPVSYPTELRFVDSPLLEGCGVDLELSQRGALLLICTSVLDEEAAARDIVVDLAELVAANRYIYIYVLLIHDIATTPNISLCICRLQNAVLQHGRQPPTRVIFKSSTTASLPESLANIIISREMSPAANSKLSLENFLENAQFCQQACFLRRLVPSLSGNGAIQCVNLARAHISPAESSFSTILTSKAIRENIMLAVTSSPSRAPEVSPGCMSQLSVLVSTRISS